MNSKVLLMGHTKSVIPQRFAFRIVTATFLVFCFLVLAYFLSYQSFDLLHLAGDTPPLDHSTFLTRKLEILRSCTGNFCISVTDLIDERKNEAKRLLHTVNLLAPSPMETNSSFVRRGSERLWTMIDNENLESIVSLIPPPNRSRKDSDTRLWAVNHFDINWQHLAAMIVAPIAVGALRIPNYPTCAGDTCTEQDIEIMKLPDQPSEFVTTLILGMGGGTVDMFFNKRFPKMNITAYELSPLISEMAHHWFDVKETPRRRTVIGDGLQAIEVAFTQGKVYNFVILDACNSDAEVPCPDMKFLTPIALKQLQSIVKSTVNNMCTIVANNVLPTSRKIIVALIVELGRLLVKESL